MCFSSGASFAASAVLGTGSIFTLKEAKRPSEYLFALCPLLFAIQQMCEGFLWIAINHNNGALIFIFSVLFLLFAQVIWPTWVPLSLLLLETDKQRKRLLIVPFLCGFFVSVIFGIRMYSMPIYTHTFNHHIYYNLKAIAWIENICKACYVMAIVVAPFLSSMKGALILGTSLTLSLLVSLFFFNENLISVWCFIAALVSLVIIYMLKQTHQTAKE